MTQIVAFVSLFLGLVVGDQPVEVMVADVVVAVEFYLDGELVGKRTNAPWLHRCSFGDDLRPHNLEAVAYDEGGKELGRATQWLNLPRQPAEAGIIVTEGEDGRDANASLTWKSLVGAKPKTIKVSFDGLPLEFDDPYNIPLPPFDPAQLHYLRAELQFAENVSSVSEVTFGGAYGQTVDRQLTAVPVAVGERESPGLEALAGRFRTDSHPLHVVAVDEGPAEVVIVRDLKAQRALDSLGRGWRKQVGTLRYNRTGSQALKSVTRLKENQTLRFLTPVPTHNRKEGYTLFPRSPEFTRDEGGVYWLMTGWRPHSTAHKEQQLADAVAVAGMSAAARNRRRAVVLVLSGDHSDISQLSAQHVRQYLRDLHVPLHVWLPERHAPAERMTAWGQAIDISTLGKLERAVTRLSQDLDHQRIVWIDGFHLPQEIALVPGSDEVQLVN